MGICLGTSPACLLRVPAPLLLPAVCCSASRQAALTLGHLLQRRLSPAPRAVTALHRRSPIRIRLFKSQCHMEKIVHRRASSMLRRARAPAARNPCRASATGLPVALPRVARFLLAPSVALPRVARFLLAPPLMPRSSFCTQDSNLELCADDRLGIDFPPWVLRSSCSQSNRRTIACRI